MVSGGRDGEKVKLQATKRDERSGGHDAPLPAALGNGEDFLMKVLGGIQSPVFVKDEAFRFTFVNQAFCDFMGRGMSELIGRTDFDVVSAVQAQVFRDVDAEVLA